MIAPRLTTCLWFSGDAAEALAFYQSVFGEALTVLDTIRLGDDGSPVFTVEFELFGARLLMINEPRATFPFTEAISLVVPCRDQAEIDRYWSRLTADGGKPVQCGWLTDRFGLSWQIVPDGFGRLVAEADPARRKRILDVMMPMVKLDKAALWAA